LAAKGALGHACNSLSAPITAKGATDDDPAGCRGKFKG
jgi:hypothetical protein